MTNKKLNELRTIVEQARHNTFNIQIAKEERR